MSIDARTLNDSSSGEGRTDEQEDIQPERETPH